MNRWVWKQQRDYQKGKLSKEQIKCLKSLRVTWIPKDGKSPKKRKRDDDEESASDDDDEGESEDEGGVAIPIIKSSWDLMFDEVCTQGLMLAAAIFLVAFVSNCLLAVCVACRSY